MLLKLLQRPKVWQIGLYSVLFAGIFLSLQLFHHPFSILSIQELSGGHTILNMKGWYNAVIAQEHLQAYSTEAIAIYRRILYLDMFVLIPGYCLLFLLYLRYLAVRTKAEKTATYQWIIRMIVLAALANYSEDALMISLLREIPDTPSVLATISGLLSTLKFAGLTVGAVLLFKAWLDYRKMLRIR